MTRKKLLQLAEERWRHGPGSRPRGLLQEAEMGREITGMLVEIHHEARHAGQDWLRASVADLRALVDAARGYYPVDGAHGWDHIRDVAKHARKLAGRDLTLLEYAAVLFHDAGIRDHGREQHELRSAEIASRWLGWLGYTPEECVQVAQAIREHRASYKGALSGAMSELLSSADRNPPDLRTIVIRAAAHRLWELGRAPSAEDLTHICADVCEHVRGKYGRDGYARYPDLYRRHYGAVLQDMAAGADDLTAKAVLLRMKDAGLV